MTHRTSKKSVYVEGNDGRFLLVFSFLFLIILKGYGQTPGTNSFRTRTPQVAVTALSQLDTIVPAHQAITIQYTDGLGRPLQNVDQGSSPLQKDIVTPYQYDSLGRQQLRYLPYADEGTLPATTGSYRPLAVQSVLSFYNPASPGAPAIATDVAPVAQTNYELSPLGRPLEQGNVGVDYQPGTGHTVSSSYESYSPSQTSLKVWTISGKTVSGSSAYLDSTLNQAVTKDGNGHHEYLWTDRLGRVVGTKSADAPSIYNSMYEVYNPMEQLGYVITSGGVRELALKASSTFTESPTDAVFMEHVYAYHYDSLGRAVEKKIPGKGWQYLVYNRKDQPVLSQDSNQRAKNQWQFTRYDALGRVIQTGIYTNKAVLTRTSMQALCDNNYPVLWETYIPGTGYTASTFPENDSPPNTAIVTYSNTYYDNYTFPGAQSKPYRPTAYDLAPSLRTRGLVTGESVMVLGKGTILTTVNYYDSEDRRIQQQSDNHLGFLNQLSQHFNFIRELVWSKSVTQTSPTDSSSVQYRYSYDQSGRLVDLYQKVFAAPEITLAHQSYNELGQLAAKGLNYSSSSQASITENSILTSSKTDIASQSVLLVPGFVFAATPTASFLASISGGKTAQTIQYRYSIRGQIRSINNASLTPDNGITQSDSTALFGEQVNYSETTPGIASMPQYDGKISSIQWRNKIEATKIAGVVGGSQGFGLGYDALSRLSTSTYYQLSGTTWAASAAGAFGESVLRYDEMGNIDSLVRKDKNGAVLNRLGYRYLNKGNRLGGVMDGGSEGFTSSYSYDGNGNILADSKKGITMTYNYLDLVDTVKQGTSRLVFTYDAQGTKLYKQLLVGGLTVSQRHYVGDAEVTASDAVTHDGKIEFVKTPVGRLVALGNHKYSEEYFLQDHLGNNRATFRVDSLGASGISFVQNYYPFGRDMGDGTINYTASPASLYKYSDKEFQPELSLNTYDFGARHYDPRIGRWIGIDALAEDYLNVSGYTYVMNDPIGVNDPDGMQLEAPYNFTGAPVVTGGAAAPGVVGGVVTGVLSAANAVLPWVFNKAPDKIINYSGYRSAPTQLQNANEEGDHSLSEVPLMFHYTFGNGSDFVLSHDAFNKFLNTMNSKGRLNNIKKRPTRIPSVPGLYRVSVNAYGTEYENSVGLTDLYYNKTGFVGYSDYWNFDPKPPGQRSENGERLVRLFQYWPGKPFLVEYGIRPLDKYIPKYIPKK